MNTLFLALFEAFSHFTNATYTFRNHDVFLPFSEELFSTAFKLGDKCTKKKHSSDPNQNLSCPVQCKILLRITNIFTFVMKMIIMNKCDSLILIRKSTMLPLQIKLYVYAKSKNLMRIGLPHSSTLCFQIFCYKIKRTTQFFFSFFLSIVKQ